ncbi:hypothetical protein IFR05_000401 [Cadophora sp. M221]|nr:hypothetical protein IFR05_000401 [Cadophora sp. M221]
MATVRGMTSQRDEDPSFKRHVKPLPQLLHPFGAGFQRPQEPPSPSGHDAAAVVAGGVAVTVTVRVLVLVLFEVVGGFPETVTMTVEVEVVNGVTSSTLENEAENMTRQFERLTSACRVTDGDVQCKSHLPPSLNWAKLLEADYAASANTTGSQPDILQKCTELIHTQGVNHAFNDRLAVAMLALLIISIILNIAQLAIALFNESAFSMLIFVPAFLDEVILVVCLGLYLGISNHEVGEYIPDGKRVSDMSLLGVGFWLLLATFCVRAISSPALFVVTLVIIVSIPIMVVSLLLCLCGGSGTVEAGTTYIVHVVTY